MSRLPNAHAARQFIEAELKTLHPGDTRFYAHVWFEQAYGRDGKDFMELHPGWQVTKTKHYTIHVPSFKEM